MKLFEHPSQCSLNRRMTHGFLCSWAFLSASSESGKDPFGIPMGCPVFSEDVKGGFGKGDVTVFGAFPPMDVNPVAFGINIGYLKV